MSAYSDNTTAWNEVVSLIREHVVPTADGSDIDGSLRAAEAILEAPWLAEHDREVAAKAINDAAQQWEYAAGYQGDNGIELRWFSLGGAYVVREAAEHELVKYDGDPSVRLVRRPAPGAWEPVVTEPAGADSVGASIPRSNSDAQTQNPREGNDPPSTDALLAAAALEVPPLHEDRVWLTTICDDAYRNWDPEPWPETDGTDPEHEIRHGFRAGWAAATRALRQTQNGDPK